MCNDCCPYLAFLKFTTILQVTTVLPTEGKELLQGLEAAVGPRSSLPAEALVAMEIQLKAILRRVQQVKSKAAA
jgi:hypothetical protein